MMVVVGGVLVVAVVATFRVLLWLDDAVPAHANKWRLRSAVASIARSAGDSASPTNLGTANISTADTSTAAGTDSCAVYAIWRDIAARCQQELAAKSPAGDPR